MLLLYTPRNRGLCKISVDLVLYEIFLGSSEACCDIVCFKLAERVRVRVRLRVRVRVRVKVRVRVRVGVIVRVRERVRVGVRVGSLVRVRGGVGVRLSVRLRVKVRVRLRVRLRGFVPACQTQRACQNSKCMIDIQSLLSHHVSLC